MEKHSFLTDFGGKGILEQKRWVVKPGEPGGLDSDRSGSLP